MGLAGGLAKQFSSRPRHYALTTVAYPAPSPACWRWRGPRRPRKSQWSGDSQACRMEAPLREWRNLQTRKTLGLLAEKAWGVKYPPPHQNKQRVQNSFGQ